MCSLLKLPDFGVFVFNDTIYFLPILILGSVEALEFLLCGLANRFVLLDLDFGVLQLGVCKIKITFLVRISLWPTPVLC